MLKTLAGGRRKTSVGGNLDRTSVGRNLGKTSAESFELTNYLICDAPSPTGREEEEDDGGGG